MQYYGTRLSGNISRREPEGYLLCLNVPVARTGMQEYMPRELSLPPGPDPVPVCRTEEEVFSPETVASFEGMPVTNNHPPDGVTVENIRAFQKGHTHNVRRGTGRESDLLLADLIITDPALIDAILAGKREISCGYTYELCEENGQYFQRRIRGNHVAVVDAGRAGPRVSIRDEQPSESPIFPSLSCSGKSIERSIPHMKKSLLKKLTCMARDGDPEAVEALAEAVEEIIENPSAAPETAVVIAAESEPETAPEPEVPAEESPAPAADADVLSAILERLDRLIALLAPAASVADDDPDEPAEAPGTDPDTAGVAPEEIAALVEEIVDPALSTVLEPENDGDENCAMSRETGDALRAALQAVRPALKRMPRPDRVRACADIAARLKGMGMDSRAYAALAAAGSRRPASPADLGNRIMARRNPNYKD